MSISEHKRNLVKANSTYIKLEFFNNYENVDFEELLFVIGIMYQGKRIFSDYELAYITSEGIKKCTKDKNLMQKALINAYAAIKKQTKDEMKVGWLTSPKLKVSSKEIHSIRVVFSNGKNKFLCVPYKIEYIFEAINHLLERISIENKNINIIREYFNIINNFTYGEKYYNTHILTFNRTEIDTTYMSDAALYCVEEVGRGFTRNGSIFNSYPQL